VAALLEKRVDAAPYDAVSLMPWGPRRPPRRRSRNEEGGATGEDRVVDVSRDHRSAEAFGGDEHEVALALE